MDLMTIQRRNYGWDRQSPYPVSPSSNSEYNEDQLQRLVKKVEAKAPVKTKYGNLDYPVDISDYGQFLSTLQTLSWVLRDVGYDITYLTRNGLHYENGQYLSYPGLFDLRQGKIVALIAVGKDGRHFRFSRDSNTLRVRKFDSVARAIAPLSASGDVGSKQITPSMVREIVRVMKTQSNLDPTSEESLRRWGRIVQSKALKPCGAGVLKSLLKLQFKRM